MPAPCTPERLHYLLTRHVIDTGHSPDITQLAALAQQPASETEHALRQLEAMHGVILVPNSLTIWSLHPFALMPTRFWVSARLGGWWANCAWCSLAIGAALGEDIAIQTGEGAEGQPLDFRVEGGKSNRTEILMHFPYPPARWWDNPYCPCGNILFFSSEGAIDAWCSRHGHAKGSILDIATGIELARKWFGDYASPEWRRKTPAQALAIFTELNLEPGFWNLEETFR